MQSKLVDTDKRPANKIIKIYECSDCGINVTKINDQWYRYHKCGPCVNIQKLSELKSIIEENGFTLLSTEYGTFVYVFCNKHGKQKQRSSNIDKLIICNDCNAIKPIIFTLETITHTIEIKYAHLKLKVIAHEFNGLSKPLKVRCMICNIEFDYNLSNLRINRGCGKCGQRTAHEKRKISFEDIKHRVEVEYKHLNLKIVGDNYVNTETPIKVECLICHIQFDYKILNLAHNTACKKCGPNAPGKWCRTPFDEMSERVQKFGFELVDIEHGVKTMCVIKCKQGHVCTRNIHDIEEGLKCPECIGYNLVAEAICRKYFEYLFGLPFKKSKFDWYINNEGNAMEIDGYNKELNLAFEYDGVLHFKFIPHFHKTIERFEKYQSDDILKSKLCVENNVTLIRVPYTIKYNKMLDYIKEQCVVQNIPFEDKENISIENLDIYNKFTEERNNAVDEGLKETNFIRSGDILNVQDMIYITCKTCETPKHVRYYDVINKKKEYDCLQCEKDTKTETLRKIVSSKNWTLIGKFNKGEEPLEIACKTCNFIYNVKPRYILSKNNITKICGNCKK